MLLIQGFANVFIYILQYGKKSLKTDEKKERSIVQGLL